MPAVSISASTRCTGSSMSPSSDEESMRASSSSSASARSITALARRINVCTAWSSTPSLSSSSESCCCSGLSARSSRFR